MRLRQYELKDRNRRKKKYATDQLDRNFRVITAHNKQQSNEQTNKTVETRLTLAGTSRGSFIRLSHASWSANGSEGKKKKLWKQSMLIVGHELGLRVSLFRGFCTEHQAGLVAWPDSHVPPLSPTQEEQAS